MEFILTISATLISFGCAIYCGIQVNFIKNTNKNNGNRNVQMNNSTDNKINTGDKYSGGNYHEK